MRPHPQIRKVVKWGGAVLAVVLCAVVSWSRSHAVTWNSSALYPNVRLAVAGGAVTLANERTGYVGEVLKFWPAYPRGRGVKFGLLWMPRWGTSGRDLFVSIPLWIPALLACMPAALTLHSNFIATRRRERAHLCHGCSYDRTGLTLTAPCPECGKTA